MPHITFRFGTKQCNVPRNIRSVTRYLGISDVDEDKMLGWSLGGGKTVQEAVALRCVCGYDILCEVRREGERLGFLAFFDGEPTSETYTKQVESCPDCGKQLGVFILSQKTKRAGQS